MSEWVKIDEVVAAYIDENQLSPNRRFSIWQTAFSGMQPLGLDYFYKVQSIKVPVNANHTATIPASVLNILKVGVFNSGGEIIGFHANDNLSNYRSLFDDRQEASGMPYDSSLYVFCNYWSGSSYSNITGNVSLCGGASIKVDKAEGTIILSNFSNLGYVMIEAVVAPEMKGEYRVPSIFRQALISYIDWKLLPKNVKGTYIWRNMKNDFYNERRLARARYTPFILQ